MYVHCHAHRLNLVLVDVVKKVSVASEFFALQALYLFLLSVKSHEEFCLRKLSET